MKPWIVLPFKSIAHGKSRLAPVLAPRQRGDLNRHLLRRALAVAAGFGGCQRILVVSHCDEVLSIARRQACRVLAEPPGCGLNVALEGAIDEARHGGAGEVLVMSCDLPLAQPGDLAALVHMGRQRHGLVLATDRPATGTNALYLQEGARIRLQYGPGSCRLHVAEAQRQGLAMQVVRPPRLAFDIDSPADLQEWCSYSRQGRCAAATSVR